MAKSKRTEVKVDRRNDDRRQTERRATSEPVAVERRGQQRRKVQRRRQIDPTTCERDYTDDEIEFMQALDAYKRKAGSSFPTSGEILQVLIELGYRRTGPPEASGATLPVDEQVDNDLDEIENMFDEEE